MDKALWCNGYVAWSCGFHLTAAGSISADADYFVWLSQQNLFNKYSKSFGICIPIGILSESDRTEVGLGIY